MTAESDDPNESASVSHPAPADQVVEAVPDGSWSALEEFHEKLGEGESDALTDEKSPEAAQPAARALVAAIAGPHKCFEEIVGRTRGPQFGAMKGMSNLLAGYQQPAIAKFLAGNDGLTSLRLAKSLPGNSALPRAGGVNGSVAAALGRSTADRAAFSIASGLKVSDSVTSVVGKLIADTKGLGITKDTLAAAFGTNLTGLAAVDVRLTARAKTSFLGVDSTLAKASVFRDLASARSILGRSFVGSELAVTRSLAMQQLVATSGIADLIGSDKMVASWRQSLLAEATARSLVGTLALPESGASLLRDIVGANAATARVVGRYAELNKFNILAPAVSARPTRELRSYLAEMAAAPDIDDLTFAVRASRGVAGIAAADLIVADGTIEDEAGDLLEAEIVEPWLTGPEAVRDLLFSRLAMLDPHVPDLLRGAWTQVEQDGPAATSMASHAVQEALDRTLRALAPDDHVIRLFVAGRLPKNSVHDKDGERHPTRAGRIAAALDERRPGETKLIAAQARALAASVTFLTANLQGGKHASKGNVGLVRTWLVSVEATFTQLLYEPGDG